MKLSKKLNGWNLKNELENKIFPDPKSLDNLLYICNTKFINNAHPFAQKVHKVPQQKGIFSKLFQTFFQF